MLLCSALAKRSQYINTKFCNIVGQSFASFSQMIKTFSTTYPNSVWHNMFDFQYPTCRNDITIWAAKRAQQCYLQRATMLYDMLRWNVAIVWLGLCSVQRKLKTSKKHRQAKRSRVIFLVIVSRSIRRTVHSNDLVKFFGGVAMYSKKETGNL